MLPLPDLVRSYVTHRLHAGPLLKEIHAGCATLLRRMPDIWYYDGQRDEDSVTQLADDVFFVCDRVEKARFPFYDRRPFVCYVEEDYDKDTIRYHTFWSRLSLTREQLRQDHLRRCARDPELKRRARVFRLVGRALKQMASSTTSSGSSGVRTRWSLRDAPSLRALARPDQVVERLRAVALGPDEEANVVALTRAALLSVGLATQGQVTDLVIDALPPLPSMPGQNPGGLERSDDPDAPPTPIAISPSDAVLERRAVREAVLTAYNGLNPDERSMLEWIALGLHYDEMVALSPALKDSATISHRLERINRCFLLALQAQLGEELRPAFGQRALTEQILSVLQLIRAGSEGVRP